MAGPLDGVRVVDFSRVLAGPLCAKAFVDLGADVVKVEPPVPDVTRFAVPGDGRVSGYYAQQNAGKRVVSLDLWRQSARDVAMRLCDWADVVVENFRPGTLRSFGLDYESVAARKPSVVYVSITGYGQRGPWRGRAAYAPTIQAESGSTAVSLDHFGDDLARPRPEPASHADIYSGLHAAIAALAALHERDRTGRGCHVDVAMAAVMLAVNERLHAELSEEDLGAEPPVLGVTDCPILRTADGSRVVVSANPVGSLTFDLLVRAMRRPDLYDDPRFRTAEDRRSNRAALEAIIQRWALTFPSSAALEAQLDEAKVALGVVRSAADVAATDWARAWGAVVEVSDRRGGAYRVPRAPWRFSGSQPAEPGTPAFQGEHNVEVLADLGDSDTEIDGLFADRALIGGRRG